MNPDLDTLATRLYVTIDDLLSTTHSGHPNGQRSGSPRSSPTPNSSPWQ